MAFSLMLTFTSCALFANNPTENVTWNNVEIMDTIPTDTIPQKDTAAVGSATSGLRTNSNVRSIVKNNSALADLMKGQTVSAALTAKETTSK